MFSFQTKDRATIARFLALAKDLPAPELDLSPTMYKEDWEKCVQEVLASEKRLASVQFWVSDKFMENKNPLAPMCNFFGLILDLSDGGKDSFYLNHLLKALRNIQSSTGELIEILEKKQLQKKPEEVK